VAAADLLARPPGGCAASRGQASGWLRTCTLVAVLLAGKTGALTAQFRGPEVASVRFEGNETFPFDSLSRAIVTRETECRSWAFYFPLPLCPLGVDFALSRAQLRERDLPRDRARLIVWYRQRGFRDVQVDSPVVTGTPTTAEVLFRIREGQPVVADSVIFVGVDDVAVPGLLDDLPIGPGVRLSTLVLDATRDTLTRRLSDGGYAYAQVLRNAFRPADDPHRALVTFDVVPGPLTTYGDITVSGTRDLGVGTVLRTARLRSGEPYRASEVEDARSRLYGLEIVRNATVLPDTLSDSRDPSVDVAITLQEGDPYRVRAGAGWSNAECLTVEGRWSARNFLGGGRLLQARARVGNLLATNYGDVLCVQSGDSIYAEPTGLVSLDFLQPWILSTRNSLTASVFVERQSLPEIYVRRAVGAQLALSRSLGPQAVLTAFYRPEVSELDADRVLFCTGFLVCTPEDVRLLEAANWLSPVGMTIARDRSDDLLNPRRGYRVLLDVEHAARWTRSDFRYDRVVAEGSRYTPVGRSVVATRMRGGWVGAGGFDRALRPGSPLEIVHPQKRFYSGGANSVRGFAQSRLGPRVLFASPDALLSQDPDVGGGCAPEALEDLSCQPVSEGPLDPRPTGGTRLIEANAEVRFPVARSLEGVLFTDVGQVWGADQPIRLSSLEFSPGLGIRIPSPVGPIRLDVAYRFRAEEALPVATERIRPFEPGSDDPVDRLRVGGEFIDWMSTGDLVLLRDSFAFGRNDRGLQFHISIGQAF
jgi:outer membrane protein assembly factor BamA